MRPLGPASANEPLDELDFRILAGVRELYTLVDPPPTDLVERIRFAVSQADAGIEMSRQRTGENMAVRSTRDRRLVTFDSEALTIMISIALNRDGTVRLDGWLTPPGSHPVELRTAMIKLRTISDDYGRFALDGITPGTAQLVVRPMAGTVSKPVTTPAIVL